MSIYSKTSKNFSSATEVKVQRGSSEARSGAVQMAPLPSTGAGDKAARRKLLGRSELGSLEARSVQGAR